VPTLMKFTTLKEYVVKVWAYSTSCKILAMEQVKDLARLGFQFIVSEVLC
jgi:hypothetical protein